MYDCHAMLDATRQKVQDMRRKVEIDTIFDRFF